MEELDFEALTKEQRVQLLLEDSQRYIDLVPGPRWPDMLDAIAKMNRGNNDPLESVDGSN